MVVVSTTPKDPKAGYHHGDLRAALIKAGLQILDEGVDPATLSLREAARRAGVSAMAPYRHFADKDALLTSLATVGFDMLTTSLRGADEAPDTQVALRGQGVAYVAFACDHPALFRLMFGPKAPTKTKALADAGHATYGVMASRVATLMPAGLAEDDALARWALVHGLAMLAVDGQLSTFSATPLELAQRITSISTRADHQTAR